MLRSCICFLLFALSISAGAQTSSGTVAQQFRISGIAVDAISGRPLPKVNVAVGPAQSSGSSQKTLTNEVGHFTFNDLKRGKYWLQAEAHGYPAQLFDQHGLFSSAIAVGPNLDSESLIFRLFPDGAILGTITDEQLEPVPDAQVMLFRTGVQDGIASTVMQAQTRVDDQGQYRFGHIPRGTYYVAASARPWYAESRRQYGSVVLTYRNGNDVSSGMSGVSEPGNSELDVAFPITFYAGATDSSAATRITVKPGEHVTADIELTPVPTVNLHITDPTIDPKDPKQHSVPILIQKVFGVAIPTSTDSYPIKPGEIEIPAVAPGQYVLTLQTFGESPSSREKQIDVSGNSDIDTGDSAPSLSLTGTVQLESGKSLPQPVVVRFENRSTQQNFLANVLANGEFKTQAEFISPGKYEISVFGVRNAAVKSLSATGATVVGHQVELGGQGAVQLKIVLSEGVGRVDGTAMLDGKFFAGAMIVLVPQDVEHDSALIRRDQSDSDGTFSLYGVLPGDYIVTAIRNGWDLPWLNPGVLDPYLKSGQSVHVVSGGRYDIKVDVR